MARALKKEQQNISKWWSDSDARKVGDRSARHIERSFSLPHGWMDNLHEHQHDLEPDQQTRTALKLQDGDTYAIPVRQGMAIDQQLRLTFLDQREGTLMLLSTDPRAYALQLIGHNPTVWLSDGWAIVIEPGTELAPNECVLLRLDTGEMLLRLVVHISDELLVVRNIVTGTQDNLPRSRIVTMEYAYIGIPPSKVRPAA
jgi:hypothetical protein